MIFSNGTAVSWPSSWAAAAEVVHGTGFYVACVVPRIGTVSRCFVEFGFVLGGAMRARVRLSCPLVRVAFIYFLR